MGFLDFFKTKEEKEIDKINKRHEKLTNLITQLTPDKFQALWVINYPEMCDNESIEFIDDVNNILKELYKDFSKKYEDSLNELVKKKKEINFKFN